jgi:hypothetical protein
MAVKTHWDIDHACGHTSRADLSERAADQRAGYARWLAKRECSDCWRANHQRDAEQTAAWLEAKRAQELADAEAWQEQFRMPPLDGPARAVPWASTVRHQLVTAAYTALVSEGNLDEADWQELEDRARSVTRAGWWIDQRDTDPADLPELLTAAADSDRTNENPY